MDVFSWYLQLAGHILLSILHILTASTILQSSIIFPIFFLLLNHHATSNQSPIAKHSGVFPPNFLEFISIPEAIGVHKTVLDRNKGQGQDSRGPWGREALQVPSEWPMCLGSRSVQWPPGHPLRVTPISQWIWPPSGSTAAGFVSFLLLFFATETLTASP